MPTLHHVSLTLSPHPTQELPILLEGVPGSGKSTLVRELARRTGNDEGLIELHLDESMDAKTLLGTYICTDVPGEFRWQAGALTQAVQAGRWVLIEDLDRAPFELLASLVPLMEAGRLHLPGHGGVVQAAPGFRLFATRTTAARGPLTGPLACFVGLWSRVAVLPMPAEELRQVINVRTPALPPALVDTIMRVCCSLIDGVVEEVEEDEAGVGEAEEAEAGSDTPARRKRSSSVTRLLHKAIGRFGRVLSTRDILTWASRVQHITWRGRGPAEHVTQRV